MIFLIAALGLYYLFPPGKRWVVLLGFSIFFYCSCGVRTLPLFIAMTAVSYLGSLLLCRNKSRELFFILILLLLLPMLLTKTLVRFTELSVFAPVGVSFFTLQIIAYLSDVRSKKTAPERNFLKYLLFIGFFPQLLQGPIPRYGLMEDLYKGHTFDEDKVIKGFMLIAWGFFLKLMIADRAGIFVDMVYSDIDRYGGTYIFIAGILYSIQLYTDFSSCVCIAKGSGEMFGITLSDNFNRPYFSDSIKDFWRRWHISLSMFLRDYIYIPLGGSRAGKLRKYVNIMITFLVSGIWHGGGLNYIFWGMLHGTYEILQELLGGLWKKAGVITGFDGHRRLVRLLNILITGFCVMTAWIIFRAESLSKGLNMVLSMFTRVNPWILFNDSLILDGFEMADWNILALSVMILIMVSILQEKGVSIRDRILSYPLLLRGALYMAVILICVVFGEYGEGFETGSYIYAGF